MGSCYSENATFCLVFQLHKTKRESLLTQNYMYTWLCRNRLKLCINLLGKTKNIVSSAVCNTISEEITLSTYVFIASSFYFDVQGNSNLICDFFLTVDESVIESDILYSFMESYDYLERHRVPGINYVSMDT